MKLCPQPYFFHQHYSRASRIAQAASQMTAETLKQQKNIFAVESFLVRMPERESLYRQALSAAPDAAACACQICRVQGVCLTMGCNWMYGPCKLCWH